MPAQLSSAHFGGHLLAAFRAVARRASPFGMAPFTYNLASMGNKAGQQAYVKSEVRLEWRTTFNNRNNQCAISSTLSDTSIERAKDD